MRRTNVVVLPFRVLLYMQLTPTHALGYSLALSFASRALKHRSLSPDDPFGERSAYNDPADGFYGAWSGVNLDAFANAASSDEVRTAHFGPEWSRFTTIGRVSLKLMKEQGALDVDAAPSTEGDGKALPRLLSAEQLHLRELQLRRKSLEKNYATYEEYVAKEFGVADGDDDVEDTCANCPPGVERAAEDLMPLPEFMAGTSQPCRPGDATPQRTSGDGPFARRREGGVRAERPLTQKVLDALGEPHGDPQLPSSDPLHWDTDDIIFWLLKMEAARLSSSANGANAEGAVVAKETPLMQDLSLQEAFRMARANGEFLLRHTTPCTLFKVMRRWYLQRQEIIFAVMKEDQKNRGSDTDSTVGADVDVFICCAVESGKKKLHETAMKVTPELIQETICQCYPYCR